MQDEYHCRGKALRSRTGAAITLEEGKEDSGTGRASPRDKTLFRHSGNGPTAGSPVQTRTKLRAGGDAGPSPDCPSLLSDGGST